MDTQIIQKILQQKKNGEHVSCEYSMSTIWPCKKSQNKHNLYHRKDCMKEFC